MSAEVKEFMLSFDQLQALARRHRPHETKNLMLGLTERFLSDADVYAQKHGDEFGDIICHLLDEVPVETRALLSGLVAPLGQFPGTVVVKLANDSNEVAGPILEQSPVLSDTDLADLAGTANVEKLLSIARRKKLGVRLTEVMVRRDEGSVIREMASNPGAKFSSPTYRLVAEKAKTDLVLQETLVQRTDIAPAITIQLHPFMSQELKDKLNAVAVAEAGSLLDGLDDIGTSPKKKQEVKAPDVANIQVAVQQVHDGKLDASNIAIEMAEEGSLAGLSVFIGGIARLSEKSVKAALMNNDPKPIAVICRGLNLSVDAFAAISFMRGEQMSVVTSEIELEVKNYEKRDLKEAQKMLAALQKRKASEPIFNPA